MKCPQLLILIFTIAAFGAASAKIDIENKVGSQLSIGKNIFSDETGSSIQMETFFKKGRPVFIAPVYYSCPGVCTFTLNHMFENLKKLGFNPGTGIEVVVFSIDPHEDFKLAAEKKKTYLKKYGFEQFNSGIHFLTADQTTITQMTKDLGFFYEKQGEIFNHPSAFFLLSGSQKIFSYFNGRNLKTKRLKKYVYEAAIERRLSAFDKMVIACKKGQAQKSEDLNFASQN